MKIFKNLFRKKGRDPTINRKMQENIYNYLISNNFMTGEIDDVDNIKDLNEIIYFICITNIVKTIGKMPWDLVQKTEKLGKEKIFDNYLDYKLNIRPNEYMSATRFWQTVELNRLDNGNAFVYIERGKKGEIKNLYLLPTEEVIVWRDDACIFSKEKNLIWYEWRCPRGGGSYKFFHKEIMHFTTSTSFDGVCGIPNREIIAMQLNSNKHSADFLNKLYKNGMSGSKIMIYYTGELKREAEIALAKKIESFTTRTDTGKIIPLPLGMEAKLIDMKLADAQFFENNNVNALHIAAAFGIKPNMLNDYTKSSYSNSESQQLDFYVNTLQPVFTQYEQELVYKIYGEDEIVKKGIRLYIDYSILFKMDSNTQAEVYSKYLANGIMTANEVREKLNLPDRADGNELIVNGSSIKLSEVGNQYNQGGD